MTGLPLAVRHPDRSLVGRRIPGFLGPKDYMPTLLSLLGLEGLKGIEGQNFWPLVGESGNHFCERAFSGYGAYAGVRDREWLYFQNWGGDPRAGPRAVRS